MTTTTELAHLDRTPDLADALAAGRPYPVRDAFATLDLPTAGAHLMELRSWWLDAASGYLDLADNGCADSIHDARRALACSRTYNAVVA